MSREWRREEENQETSEEAGVLMVYVIWAKGTEFIKLGYTSSYSRNTRLKELQIGCPHELEVIAFADGTEVDEAAFHAILTDAGLHVRGEWFKWGLEAHKVVDALKAMPEPSIFKKNKPRNPHRRLGRVLEVACDG
jgi:hypothetical protein